MKCKYITSIYILLFTFLLMLSSVSATEMNNTNFTTELIIVSGAEEMNNSNYTTDLIIGQELVGYTSNSIYQTSLGFFSGGVGVGITYADNHNITIHSPTTERSEDHTVYLNVSLSGYADLNYSIDTDPEVSGCTLCTSFTTELERLSDGYHNIYFYTYNETVLTNVTMIRIELHTASGGGVSAPPTLEIEIIELPLETDKEIFIYEDTQQINLEITNPNNYTVYLTTDTGLYTFKPQETIIIPYNLNYTVGEYIDVLMPINAPDTNITINVIKTVELNMDLITDPKALYGYLVFKFKETFTFPNGDTIMVGVLISLLSLLLGLGLRILIIFNENRYIDSVLYFIVSGVIDILLLLLI